MYDTVRGCQSLWALVAAKLSLARCRIQTILLQGAPKAVQKIHYKISHRLYAYRCSKLLTN